MNQVDNNTMMQINSQHSTSFPELTDVSNGESCHSIQLEQQRRLEIMLVARLKIVQGLNVIMTMFDFHRDNLLCCFRGAC